MEIPKLPRALTEGFRRKVNHIGHAVKDAKRRHDDYIDAALHPRSTTEDRLKALGKATAQPRPTLEQQLKDQKYRP